MVFGFSVAYFKTFSSPDLVNWTDEGIILDLEKDVSWANRNAWAPCIIEKKIGDSYKYYFYFTAAQKIGVAVSDNPTGPFVDSGKALIDKLPIGVSGGQQIDPDVFTDPQTGKSYLYWGNGYMACAELNADMISIKEESIKVMTPDNTFREGTTVFVRNGKYYFLWSDDDTRSENYKVRYGTSDSPTGKINIPQNNLVIAKDKEAGLYATGHNSVIQIPGKDEWYIVYHRFNYPKGITMGDAAGFNREVCIDKMEFDKEGKIKQVRLNPVDVNGVVTYETVVGVSNEELLLRPGMTATAQIITKQSLDKLIIPNTALRFKPKIQTEQKASTMNFVQPPKMPQGDARAKELGKKEFVPIFVLENNQPKRVMVKVLDTDGKSTTIETNDLKVDDEVIVSQKSENGK